MNTRWRRILGLVGGIVVVGATFGCGVAAESAPTPIDRDSVPFGLAARNPTGATTTTRPQPFAYTVYLVAGERLHAIERGSTTPISPRAILRKLVKGPLPSESESGVRTLLDPSVTIAGVTVRKGIATIDLEDTLDTLRPAGDATLAVAQLVYTATSLPGVSKVQLRIDGEDVELPRDDGTLTKQPVGRADYPASAP
jgi:spore germination protein GerM